MPHRLAFYAPLKPADHAVPSGDREMARLLMRALAKAGFQTEVASALRVYDAKGGADFTGPAQAEIGRLIEHYRSRPASQRPRLWFSYHVYYKAPDLIGPSVARAFGIPYVVAEGSRAPRRARGPWATGSAQAEAALDAADLIFIPNPRDRTLLEAARPAHQTLIDLPPFVDSEAWPLLQPSARQGDCRLLAVAMMREGDKLASYALLAQALARLGVLPWRLDIVGDGPARAAVEGLFAPFGNRIALHGRIDDRHRLARLYAQADMLVWPAVNEAFGMVFLEAALQGCPAIAGAFGGVGTVVSAGQTGLLTRPGDVEDFAAAIWLLATDEARRKELCAGAMRFARTERSLERAAQLLRHSLLDIMTNPKPAS